MHWTALVGTLKDNETRQKRTRTEEEREKKKTRLKEETLRMCEEYSAWFQ